MEQPKKVKLVIELPESEYIALARCAEWHMHTPADEIRVIVRDRLLDERFLVKLMDGTIVPT